MIDLDRYSAPIVAVYEALVDELMVNIARHFNTKATGNTASFSWEVRKLAELGQVQRENAALIARRVAENEPMIELAIQQAMLDALEEAEPELRSAARAGLLNGSEQSVQESIQAKLTSYSRQAVRQLNLVNTVMLDGTLNAYRKMVSDVTLITKQLETAQAILNAETGKVITGVSTRQEAVRKALRDMAEQGLTGFIDRGGHHWTPEAYVAMDIRTTCGNAATQAVFDRNAAYGNDLVWVVINATARPGCYPWQGKVISMNNRGGTVRDLDGRALTVCPVSATTYGEPDGLWGINCHHKPPNVFVPGVSQIRGTVPDKAGNDQRYEQSQRQRRLEREVRYAKRDAAMMDAAGDKEGFDEAAIWVKRATKELKGFAEATGLPLVGDRIGVLGYNRSVAGKATAANQAFEKYRATVPNANPAHFKAYQEIRAQNLVKGHVVPVERRQALILADLASKREPDHIMKRMLERHITDDEVQSYVDNAVLCVRQYKGTRLVYYSENGVCVLTRSKDYPGVEWITKTTWRKEDFNKNVEAVLEVAKRYGTK